MASHVIGNRNSTPEASKSSLRPPSSRALGGGSHQLRASADMSSFASPLSTRSIRPSSEVFYNQQSQPQNTDDIDKAAQQWIADIDQYETTLEEMAAATLDQDFKDELSAIEQWFRVLSEAERTAALYALLQQTTQVQIRFFIQVLQQMSKSHPMSSVLSPANFGEKDPMNSRLTDAMSKLNVEGSRNSFGRPPLSPGNKRNSGLDSSTINAMFPDAAAAIAKQRAEFTQQTGAAPTATRNSAAFGERSSLIAPTISAPDSGKDNLSQPPSSPWVQRTPEPQPPIARPKSSSGQQQPPMGQFVQPPQSAGLRSPRPLPQGSSNIQNTIVTAPDLSTEPPLFSPYNVGNASWASMANTPSVATFSQQQNAPSQADMVANATAMKLAALSTVNNRIALDDARKYRRARSNDGQGKNLNINQQPLSPGIPKNNLPATNLIMVNDVGQILNAQQIAALQAQQQAAMSGRRSRPNSPGIAMQGGGMGHMNFASPQNNGFLAAYDTNALLNNGFGGLNVAQFSGNHEGYLSDHSEIARGRSPRGRRGSSKPPEDPTDPHLLQDIPSWLRSLRLHKYTENLKDLKWTELIELNDKGLEERGVNALGARNKMLKVFEQVKEARAEGKLNAAL
ncbi:SAM domain-containing protein [Histoplasma capsulatum var. duboisii H88]|uniref:RNA-binding protein VTS1 n=4 Tax=Ajellomyces capsulatus TaxID=5037 RepID=C0NC99_AJECG|nr:SAM domain-containing protein [Histoplasma capsulatum G186AR]EER43335.1 SAM domain-containing protein [Histoplasma capsulatum H143]EGC46269.1 SAM domain-containing protein [Histoplasma capsulatum var. duboisii H88]KAG5302867.1 SAM domain-containing protein [Histoplasma capsulatum]EEH11290.1 SAM domain-containing protein [Histoplasma capsulatum G186AR]QSS56892.1 SAM domain-containing protein [Histoplasma capsulatum var. duboisii H88]